MTITLHINPRPLLTCKFFVLTLNGMPRPKKEEAEVRGKLLQVRLTDDEHKLFRGAAKSSGLDMSSWVRVRLLAVSRRDLREAQDDAALVRTPKKGHRSK